jgi:ferredoxin
MMGFRVDSDALPITKAANCILALTPDESPDPGEPLACIRCGRCAEVCPANLLPQQLYWHARAKDLDKVQDYNLFDCIECGCCAVVCPSHIPLVQYYRFAKTESWARESEKRAGGACPRTPRRARGPARTTGAGAPGAPAQEEGGGRGQGRRRSGLQAGRHQGRPRARGTEARRRAAHQKPAGSKVGTRIGIDIGSGISIAVGTHSGTSIGTNIGNGSLRSDAEQSVMQASSGFRLLAAQRRASTASMQVMLQVCTRPGAGHPGAGLVLRLGRADQHGSGGGIRRGRPRPWS